jgi:uncharacterized damage-inducible protein DinB
MTSEFSDDLSRLRAELSEARREFLAIVDSVPEGKLDNARRGGWSARRVLDHVISSEQAYARVIGHLRRKPIEGEVPPSQPASVEDATAKLSSARDTLLGALDGVDEDSFYTLQQLGHEEYSVLSVLENARSHDHEHGEQLSEILKSS